jgi:quercetin dioxygenase-like cupin family protein
MDGHESCLDAEHEIELCGIWLRPRVLNSVGEKINGHRHYFDHVTIVIAGEADVIGRYPDGSVAFRETLKQGDYYPIQKDIEHEFTATVAPYRHFCVFPSRTPNNKITGETTRWSKASG